jgi:hypothetical protein
MNIVNRSEPVAPAKPTEPETPSGLTPFDALWQLRQPWQQGYWEGI